MRDHIILRRSGALGDVILATPVLRRLRREFPDALISAQTGYPEVFDRSPHINAATDDLHYPPVLINLDGAYERRPDLHIVQAYMLEAFGDLGDPKELQQELRYSADNIFSGGTVRSQFIAVHAAVAGWKNRTLPRQVWLDVVAGIREMGFTPVMVGAERDRLPDDIRPYAALNQPLFAQAAVIDRCGAFVGSDSAMLHLAGATETPIIGVFTCARPETRLPWRHGQLGWRCEAVMPDLECVGCQARRPPPVTDERCERGDTRCIELVSAANILAALQKVIAL